jgi:hypothetical protein
VNFAFAARKYSDKYALYQLRRGAIATFQAQDRVLAFIDDLKRSKCLPSTGVLISP